MMMFSEKDIDGVMMDILERAYKPQAKADKIKSIYMHHYDDIVRLLKKLLKVRQNSPNKFLQLFATGKRTTEEILEWRRFSAWKKFGENG